ncbi:hypothetical protein ACFZBU_03280 [Embleya sp. NPDC008237]|uniref:hypothetical protein n=1 Tax=Embleya sp. NPDC008237 TaxID=3363978 RepID=UPI0036E1DAA9
MTRSRDEVVGAALSRWAAGRFPLPADPGHRWYLAREGAVAALAGAATTLRAAEPDAAVAGWVGDADPDQIRVLAAASARPPALVVVGAAGTGKTRTAAMVIRREQDAGGRVLVVTRQRYGARRLWAELARSGVTSGLAGMGAGAGGDDATRAGVGAGDGLGAGSDGDADGPLLDRHLRSMVEPYGAWGSTLGGIQDHLIGRPPWTGPVLDRQAASVLDPDEAGRLGRELERFAHAGGLRDAAWHGVRIDTPEQARTTVGEIAELRSRFREIRAGAAGARLHADRPEPRDLAEWTACLVLVKRLRQFSIAVDPEILAGPYSMRQLLAATRWYGRPAARRYLRDRTRFPADRAAMRLTLVEARTLHGLFRAQSGGVPEAASLRGMVLAWADSERERQALAGYATSLFPILNLPVDTSLPEIGARLDRLAESISADGASWERLADRCRSYRDLATAGLGPLVADLTARGVSPGRVADEYERFLYTSLAHACTGGEPGAVVGLQAHAHRYRTRAAATAAAAAGPGPGAGTRRRPSDVSADANVRVMSPRDVRRLPDTAYFDLVVIDDAGLVSERDVIPALLRAGRVVLFGDPTGPGLGDPDGPGEPGDAGSEGDLRSALASVSRFVEPVRIAYIHRPLDERLAIPGVLPAARLPGVRGEEAAVRHIVTGAHDLAGVVATARSYRARYPEETLAIVTLGGSQARRIRSALSTGRADEEFAVERAAVLHGGEWDTVLLSVGAKRDAEGRLIHRFGAATMPGGDALVASAVSRARRRLVVMTTFEEAELDSARLRAPGARLLRTVLRHAATGGRGAVVGEIAAAGAGARGSRVGAGAGATGAPDAFHADVLDRLRAAGLEPIHEFGGRAGVVIALPGLPADPGTAAGAGERAGARTVDGLRARATACRYPADAAGADSDETAVAIAGHPGTHAGAGACHGDGADAPANAPAGAGPPRRMVVAIETDRSAAYRAEPSVREREWLRPARLEERGWVVYRLWSGDWIRDPDRQIRQIVALYRSAARATGVAATKE